MEDSSVNSLLKFVVFIVFSLIVVIGLWFGNFLSGNKLLEMVSPSEKNETQNTKQHQISKPTSSDREKVNDSFKARSERIEVLKEVGKDLGGGQN